MIKINNLNKYYFKGKSNEVHVIANTSLELPNTGLVTFLGFSGSGKTTLLNVIGGLDKASGKIEYENCIINNYDMKKIDKYRKENIGYIFQNYNLILDETVTNNLKLYLEILGITDEKEVEARIEYALKAVGMFKYRKKKAFALSGGQQQRVSIARALVKNSKILIADEPTGNLDIENTIEIMKILKRISKKSLVLLVTHNQSIAEAYSDKIYEICDGKITGEREVSSTGEIDVISEKNIYLKDMKEETVTSNIGEITVYSDEELTKALDLKLIVKNGTLYIDGPCNIKIVKDSNINLLNESYTPVIASDVSDDVFDNSWFDNSKKNNIFKDIISLVKESYHSIKNSKKLIKFLYFSLFFIGCILGFSVIAYSNAVSVDMTGTKYNNNYYTMINDEYKNTEQQTLKDAYDNGYIDEIMLGIEISYNVKHQLSFNQYLDYSYKFKLSYYNENNVNVVIGKAPTTLEDITIPYKEAKEIVDNSDKLLSFEELIGKEVNVSVNGVKGDYKICGISKDDQGYAYLIKDSYLKFVFSSSIYLSFMDVRYKEDQKINDGYAYTVVKGRDVDVTSNTREILVLDSEYPNLEFGPNKPLERIKIYGDSYTVVGTFSYKYEVNTKTYIVNIAQIYGDSGRGVASFGFDQYEIVEGRNYENDDEVIVPTSSRYQIGEYCYGRTVVGKYVGSSLAYMYSGVSTSNSTLLERYSKNTVFTTNDAEVLNNFLSDTGCVTRDTFEDAVFTKKIEQNNSEVIFEILFVILLLVSIIFIFLIMRSKMITDIYNIGVHRALGSSRWQICRRFIVESIVLTVYTTLFGYVIILGLYQIISGVVNNFIEGILFKIDWTFAVLGGFGTFVILIFFGVLPIINLLKKTPSEICSKYDI